MSFDNLRCLSDSEDDYVSNVTSTDEKSSENYQFRRQRNPGSWGTWEFWNGDLSVNYGSESFENRFKELNCDKPNKSKHKAAQSTGKKMNKTPEESKPELRELPDWQDTKSEIETYYLVSIDWSSDEEIEFDPEKTYLPGWPTMDSDDNERPERWGYELE